MRVAVTISAALLFQALCARADIAPETISTSTMAMPQASWFIVNNGSEADYIFDAADGQMQGLLALSDYTPRAVPNLERREFYAPESYYSRGVRGERTDILVIFDMATLTPKAEVEIPKKFESGWWARNVGLLDDGRHFVIFNMSPGQSVTVVDIIEQRFVGEISTPGCSTLMPVESRSFLMICGDGALQLIRLDDEGRESDRIRGDQFFSVEDDPIGDKPVKTANGWLFQSFENLIYEATVEGDRIVTSEPWSLLSDEDAKEGWRIGSSQPMTLNRHHDLLYTLMHVGDVHSRDDPATEVWVYDRETRRRLARITPEHHVSNTFVTQGESPLLLLLDEYSTVVVHDGISLKKLRDIPEAGPRASGLQGFGPND